MFRNIKIPRGAQIRAARCLLKLTQEQCATAAGVSLSTLKKFEQLEDTDVVLMHIKYDKVMKILNSFKDAGINFEVTEGNVGVYLDISEKFSLHN